MASIEQWPLRQPRRVAALDLALCGGGAIAIGYCVFLYSFYIVPVVPLLVLWRFWRQRRYRSCGANAQLCFRETGWRYEQSGVVRPLALTHAWPAFAWMTLRFRALALVGRKETMLELTLWKSSMPPDAWRRLCVIVAGQRQAPSQASGRDIV